MKSKMINQTHIEGKIYESKLELKESGPNSKHPGTQFISGNLDIATDDDLLNNFYCLTFFCNLIYRWRISNLFYKSIRN